MPPPQEVNQNPIVIINWGGEYSKNLRATIELLKNELSSALLTTMLFKSRPIPLMTKLGMTILEGIRMLIRMILKKVDDLVSGPFVLCPLTEQHRHQLFEIFVKQHLTTNYVARVAKINEVAMGEMMADTIPTMEECPLFYKYSAAMVDKNTGDVVGFGLVYPSTSKRVIRTEGGVCVHPYTAYIRALRTTAKMIYKERLPEGTDYCSVAVCASATFNNYSPFFHLQRFLYVRQVALSHFRNIKAQYGFQYFTACTAHPTANTIMKALGGKPVGAISLSSLDGWQISHEVSRKEIGGIMDKYCEQYPNGLKQATVFVVKV